jgi:hypothetical protein
MTTASSEVIEGGTHMKRLRLRLILGALAISMFGVQAVNALCPIGYTMFYSWGRKECSYAGTSNGYCTYNCKDVINQYT